MRHASRTLVFRSSVLTLCVLCFGSLDAATPVGVVALVNGKAVIHRDGQKLDCLLYNHIYEGGQIETPANATVTVAFRNDGHVEHLKTPGTRTATLAGMTPRDGVDIRALKQNQQLLVRSTVGSLPGSSLQGMVTLRSVDRAAETRPINGNLLNAGNLKFAWPVLAEAKSYVITVRPESQVHPARPDESRLVFRGRVASHKASLTGRSEFQPGVMYFWEVDAELANGTLQASHANGHFIAASQAQIDLIAQCQELLADGDPGLISLAAVSLYDIGAKEEAIAAYQALARYAPQNPLIHVALGTLYKQIQWQTLGEQSYEVARKLGYDSATYARARDAERDRSSLTFPGRDLEVFVEDAIYKLEGGEFWETFLVEFVALESRNRIDRRQEYSLLQALRTIRGLVASPTDETDAVTFPLQTVIGGLDAIEFRHDKEQSRWYLSF